MKVATKTLTAPQQAWIDALRSGEYKQGPVLLRNITNNTWSAAGVLCDLYLQEYPSFPVEQYTFTFTSDRKDSEVLCLKYGSRGEYIFVLPPEVEKWVQFSRINGTYLDEEDDIHKNIYRLNDYEDLSFHAIADILEINAERIFK